MDPIKIVKKWAKTHKQIIGVVLGGSRAKGTHTATSDYDFAIQIITNPTKKLVERLCKDLGLSGGKNAVVFPKIDRHFVIVGKNYKQKDFPEITIAFTNLKVFYQSLKNETNHPLVDQMFEFYKTSKIIWDPKKYLRDIQKKADVNWARKKVMDDARRLIPWSVEKYSKALLKDKVAANLVKHRALWHITIVISSINNIPLGSHYDYITFKLAAKKQGKKFLAPDNFFKEMEYISTKENPKRLSKLSKQVESMAKEFLHEPK